MVFLGTKRKFFVAFFSYFRCGGFLIISPDRYAPILLGLMLRILRSRPEAEDVLQEVFLQVWQQARSFDPARGRAFTWLATLARSRAPDRLRAVAPRGRAAEPWAGDGQPPAAEAVG